MQDPSIVDLQKRRTLQGLTGLGVGALIGGLPAAALANTCKTHCTDATGAPADIAGTLISSPDVVEDTLILRNLTDSPITITHFHANRLVFDGDIVDCNDACVKSAITLPVGVETSVQVIPQRSNYLNSPAGEYLDIHAQTDRLPNGTRVVPFVGRVLGKAVVLSEYVDTTTAHLARG